jgi:hypothetical protein
MLCSKLSTGEMPDFLPVKKVFKSEFDGEIVLVNSEDPSDTCVIDVSLATPVNQRSYSSPLLQRLLERFPNMFPILRYLFEV